MQKFVHLLAKSIFILFSGSHFLAEIFKKPLFFKKTPLKKQHNFLQFYTDFKIYLYVLKLVFRRLKIRLKNVEFYVQEL
jgi:hypothetical protein